MMIKNYLKKKKQEKAAKREILNTINDFLPEISYMIKSVKPILENFVQVTELASSEEFKNLMDNMDSIAKSPKLTTNLYKEIGSTVDFQNYLEEKKKFEQTNKKKGR